MLKPLTSISAMPLSGGCITRHHKALLPFGSFSDMKNMRNENPGLRKRPGQIALHTTADTGTPEVLSLYQFRKQRIDEKHFLAQMSDGDILDATAAPPTVTTGAFGAEVHSGSASQIPGSWSIIDDILLHSNGVDQHQSYTGTANYISAAMVYDGSAAPANVPEMGTDYTLQATDGLTTTVVVLDSLDTYANNECFFICTAVPATSLTWTVSAVNGTASTATLYYRKNDNTWADTSMTDGTIITATKTLSGTGSMTWTAPTDEISMYMYGQVGFWYQLRVSAQIDSEVEVTKITFGSSFQDVRNIWDGLLPYATEALFYDQSITSYLTYSTDAIILNSMVMESGDGSDDRDRLYFSSADPIQGVYIDVAATPNTATSTFHIKEWTGAAWAEVSSMSDGTAGGKNTGWITWARNTSVEPLQFQSSQYYAYWYYIYLDDAGANFSSDVTISIQTMPYFDIEELGKGQCSTIWKDRGAYSFTLYPSYIYISAETYPFSLNGDDYGILRAGDGRTNKPVAFRKFHNELVVFQEEKGVDGGCISLFQGYSPTTFGKLLISSRIGTMSNKTVAVVDGVMTSTATEEKLKDLIFFLSRYGVCVTDGMTISIISDDIQNYFDPTETECIRRGYESKMWLNYDSAFNVVRIGLVSGGSATLPNVFPVYDLTSKTWSFDTPTQELSCMVELEAGSGDVAVLQAGGGIDDGLVYLLNSGTNDVSTAIDSFFVMELNAQGEYIQLNEAMIRAEAVASSAGDITVTFTQNAISAGTKTLSMSPETTNQTIIRHKFPMNIQDQNISIKVQNDAASKAMKVLDLGIRTQLYETR